MGKKRDKKVQCPMCFGEGWYIVRHNSMPFGDEDVDCDFCSGKGKVKESRVAML